MHLLYKSGLPALSGTVTAEGTLNEEGFSPLERDSQGGTAIAPPTPRPTESCTALILARIGHRGRSPFTRRSTARGSGTCASGNVHHREEDEREEGEEEGEGGSCCWPPPPPTRLRLRVRSVTVAAESVRAAEQAMKRAAQSRRPKRLLLYINPVGGRRRARSVAAAATALWRRLGVEVDVTITQHAGHACAALRERELRTGDAVVMAGGDGFLAEAVQGLLARSDNAAQTVPLATLPAGAGMCYGDVDYPESGGVMGKCIIQRAEMSWGRGLCRELCGVCIPECDSEGCSLV